MLFKIDSHISFRVGSKNNGRNEGAAYADLGRPDPNTL